MITLSTLFSVVIWLLIAGVIYWLVTWLIAQIGVPEPFNKIIRIIIALIVFVIALNALLMLVGTPLIRLG